MVIPGSLRILRLAPRPTFSIEHGAGVTSAQYHPHREHVVATGGYDGDACVWDARRMKSPLARVACDGGVWRLKWHPSAAHGDLLLAACMRGGFRVVDTAGIHTLTVPSCDSGIVRGPVVTDPTPAGEAVPPADCSSHTTHAFDDEAEALAAGVAALVAR